MINLDIRNLNIRRALWDFENAHIPEHINVSKFRCHKAFQAYNQLPYHSDWSDINEQPKIEPTPCRTSLRLQHERQRQ